MSEPWTPRDYQIRAVELMLENPAAGLFADPGLGKTSCALMAWTVFQRAHPKWKMLVIAPRHVVHNVWRQEAKKWSDFSHLRFAVLHGPKKAQALKEDADIYLINPEGLPWLLQQRGWKIPQVLVVDESTKFKHTNTQRFKLLRTMLDAFARRYILAGKPVPNGLHDLFGQIFILDGGARLGKFVSHFRKNYCYQSGFGGFKWKVLPEKEAEIQAKVIDITLRLDKREHLKDLPPLVENVVAVDLPHEAMDQYMELEKEFILQLREGEVSAMSAGAATAKLRQLTSGAVYLTDDDAAGRWAPVHEAKLDALDAILSEREYQPTLVAYQFNHTADRILAAYPDAVILSRLSDKKAERALAEWNKGEVPILVVHPASAAHGLNLQGGSDALVWFDPTYDLEHDDQLIARLWRQGQKHTVVNHRLVASNTIDEAIVAALRGKDRSQNQFLDALKKHFGVKETRRGSQEDQERSAKRELRRPPHGR